MKKLIVCLAVFCLLAEVPTTVKADDAGELKAQLKLLQERIEQLESNQTQQVQQIDLKVAEAVKANKPEWPETVQWIENLKFSGDFRLRHEQIDQKDNGDNKKGRSRQRFRYRFGVGAKVNEEVDIYFRLASGSDDPVSTNQSFDDGFTSKDIFIDRAYVDWHPLTSPGLNIWGGKMPNPFYTAGKNQLIWDGDLNPEGIAAKYKTALNARDELFVNGGAMWVEENSSSADQSLWGIQAGIKHLFDDKSSFTYGGSYYDYGNVQGKSVIDWEDEGNSFGNSATDEKYDLDYNIFEAFGEYAFKAGSTPMSFYGSYVSNEAAKSQNTGYLLGVTYNKAKAPGTWELGYNYRDLEADAVLGAFTDSDFIGGGTNGSGHKFGLKYQVAKNWQAGLTYFMNEKGTYEDDYRRLQVDMVFKF